MGVKFRKSKTVPVRAPGFKGPKVVLRLERDGKILHEARSCNAVFPIKIGRKVQDGWRTPADDMAISSVHAEIDCQGSSLRIVDCGSRNGMYCMGRKVKDAKLKPGVQIGLGSCRLYVEADRGNEEKRTAWHRLEVVNGPSAGKFYDLTREITPVGSAVSDGIECSSLLASRNHAEIICKSDGSCYVKDLGSRNGTRINGTPLLKDAEKFLHHRDVIAFADSEFRFWDRSVRDEPLALAKKIAVSVMTMAVCGLLVLLVQLIFPSAKSLLELEENYERRAQFLEALAVLDKVAGARGGETYTEEVARRRANIAIWQDTLAKWESVKRALSKRAWIDASKDLGTLLAGNVDRWGWNATSAQTEKRKVVATGEILDAFLSARTALGGTFATFEQSRERLVLERRLEQMKSAMLRQDWTADLPTGPYLRVDMEEQIQALSAIVADLTEIDALLDKLASPRDDTLESIFDSVASFGGIVARMRILVENSAKRNAEREKAAKESGRRFVFSNIVAEKCNRYLPVFEKFVEARRVLDLNCNALVSLDYDALVKELPLPSDFQVSTLPVFGDIRQAMSKANENLNSTLARTVRDQVGRLSRLGVGKDSVPPAIAMLLDTRKMQQVFSCDTLDVSKPPPSATRSARFGLYDEVLGIEEFGTFLATGEYRELEGGELPPPVLAQAKDIIRQLDRFSRACTSPDMKYLLKLTPPGGNKLQGIGKKVADMRRKKKALVDYWKNWNKGGIRTTLIAHGAAIALDDGETLNSGTLDKPAYIDDFQQEFNKWKNEISRFDRRIKANPLCVEEVRPQLLEIAIPGVAIGRASRHWTDEAAKRGGGR